jgi:hypothetical protein
MVVGQMRYAVALTGLAATSVLLAAGLLFVLSGGPVSWSYGSATGMAIDAVAIGTHGSPFACSAAPGSGPKQRLRPGRGLRPTVLADVPPPPPTP